MQLPLIEFLLAQVLLEEAGPFMHQVQFLRMLCFGLRSVDTQKNGAQKETHDDEQFINKRVFEKCHHQVAFKIIITISL